MNWKLAAYNAVCDVIRDSEYSNAAIFDGDEVAMKALKREISAAYPFGARSNYPYKVWLKMVRDVLALKSMGMVK